MHICQKPALIEVPIELFSIQKTEATTMPG